MNRLATLTSLTLLSLVSLAAQADSVPYANVGKVAPQSTLTASATGDVIGYFVQGGAASHGGAGDTDYMVLFDSTANTYSPELFDNQTTQAGAVADFGHVNAGDNLIFELIDTTTHDMAATNAAYSGDHLNHGYVTAFAGGPLNGAIIPAGTYVGMEDRLLGQQWDDFNYNDDSFVFNNVAASTPTPEPNPLILLATGLFGVALLVRRLVRD